MQHTNHSRLNHSNGVIKSQFITCAEFLPRRQRKAQISFNISECILKRWSAFRRGRAEWGGGLECKLRVVNAQLPVAKVAVQEIDCVAKSYGVYARVFTLAI